MTLLPPTTSVTFGRRPLTDSGTTVGVREGQSVGGRHDRPYDPFHGGTRLLDPREWKQLQGGLEHQPRRKVLQPVHEAKEHLSVPGLPPRTPTAPPVELDLPRTEPLDRHLKEVLAPHDLTPSPSPTLVTRVDVGTGPVGGNPRCRRGTHGEGVGGLLLTGFVGETT